ncbi:MAG: tRNA pseudouridine synthase A [Bacteroidota bacterium]|nr:tRNA pseudouridine synthase A [Bacteroidota bacterium]
MKTVNLNCEQTKKYETMHTLKLKINDQVYDKLIWLLGKFTKDEVEIIMDESNFNETKKYLDAELDEITSGKAKFFTVNEAEQRLENLIKKHENHL